MSVKIPLSAVFEDHWINLRGDKYVDPESTNHAYENPLLVFEAYSGQPKGTDRHRVRNVEYFPAEDENDEIGITLILSPGDGAKATLIYFPDDQHEIELVEKEPPSGTENSC